MLQAAIKRTLFTVGLGLATLILWPTLALAQAPCEGQPIPQDGCATHECINNVWVCPESADASPSLKNPLAPGGGSLDPNELFARVAKGFTRPIGAAALFFALIGGYIIITAAGNSERYAKGKKTIAYSLIGFVVAVGSYVLLAMAIDVATGWQGLAPLEKYRLTDPLRVASPEDFYGGRLARFFVSGLAAITVLMSVYGGLQWMTAAGNEEKIKKARQTISYAFIGAILVLSSYALINFVYVPIYRLFSSGTTPPAASGPVADPSDTRQVVCFRRELGNEYGATCSLETIANCFKARDNLQRGEIYAKYTDCGQIGSCVQESPGTYIKNRIEASQCPSGADEKHLFPAIARALDGDCMYISGTQASTVITAGRPDVWCFANIKFEPGKDYPLNGESACLREITDGSGRLTGVHDCNMLTAFQCSRANDDTHAYATWYKGRDCGTIGYCEQNWSSHYSCKNGLVEALCYPTLFPSVGVPVPPWGCSPYAELGGNCYVPQAGIHFESYGPGKECPRRP